MKSIVKRLTAVPGRISSLRSSTGSTSSAATTATTTTTSKPAIKEEPPHVAPEHHAVNDETWTHIADRVLVRALFEFQAQAEGDLSFYAEQVIQVTMKDDLWYLGTYLALDGTEKVGVFPQNYVETLPSDTTLPNVEQAYVTVSAADDDNDAGIFATAVDAELNKA